MKSYEYKIWEKIIQSAFFSDAKKRTKLRLSKSNVLIFLLLWPENAKKVIRTLKIFNNVYRVQWAKAIDGCKISSLSPSACSFSACWILCIGLRASHKHFTLWLTDFGSGNDSWRILLRSMYLCRISACIGTKFSLPIHRQTSLFLAWTLFTLHRFIR